MTVTWVPVGIQAQPALGNNGIAKFVRKHYGLTPLEVLEHPANTRQPIHPPRIGIFCYQVGAFPHPADLTPPAAPSLG
jgi:hypothetical protein